MSEQAFVDMETELRKTVRRLLAENAALKAAVEKLTARNNASIQLPRSCRVCVLNKACKEDHDSEQCWHHAVTAYFA